MVREAFLGQSIKMNFLRTKDPNGNSQDLNVDRPIFLVGTFNKILQYSYDIFYQLQYLLYDKLNYRGR